MERRQFTREFKLEAVRLIKQRRVSYAQTSKDLGVHPTRLRNWVKQLADDPQHAFPDSGRQPFWRESEPYDGPHHRTAIQLAGAPTCYEQWCGGTIGRRLLPDRVKQRAIQNYRLLARQDHVLVFDFADIKVATEEIE